MYGTYTAEDFANGKGVRKESVTWRSCPLQARPCTENKADTIAEGVCQDMTATGRVELLLGIRSAREQSSQSSLVSNGSTLDRMIALAEYVVA